MVVENISERVSAPYPQPFNVIPNFIAFISRNRKKFIEIEAVNFFFFPFLMIKLFYFRVNVEYLKNNVEGA